MVSRFMAEREALAMEQYLRVAPAVAAALAAGRPVVALESTVIAHGLPRPTNVEVALALEAAIHAEGATPATIALLDGQIVVGMSDEEIARLGAEPGVWKASRRDLAVALARHATAATTVAGTLACAALAGVRVFSTGGIGGAHRGAASSFDISADLPELARAPIVTVCAGGQSDSRSAAHAGISGDAGRSGHRLSDRRAARVLHP
jgi:pseudouridylate synthase